MPTAPIGSAACLPACQPASQPASQCSWAQMVVSRPAQPTPPHLHAGDGGDGLPGEHGAAGILRQLHLVGIKGQLEVLA